MVTDARLFDEIAAACQFPDYFGENWNALRDCLADLEWMPAERYVIVVTSAESMAAAAPDLFQHFVVALRDIAEEWAHPGPGSQEARPFHVVLRTQAGAESVVRLLRNAGVEYDQRPWPG
jgi:hypothetical protein